MALSQHDRDSYRDHFPRIVLLFCQDTLSKENEMNNVIGFFATASRPSEASIERCVIHWNGWPASLGCRSVKGIGDITLYLIGNEIRLFRVKQMRRLIFRYAPTTQSIRRDRYLKVRVSRMVFVENDYAATIPVTTDGEASVCLQSGIL